MDIEEMVSESELFPRTANHSASPPPLVFTQVILPGLYNTQVTHKYSSLLKRIYDIINWSVYNSLPKEIGWRKS